jgi:two-component system sporulation sensor kinase A
MNKEKEKINIKKYEELHNRFKEVKENYDLIIQNIQDIIYRANTKGYVTYISPQVRQLGFAEDFFIGKRVDEIVLPEDREKLMSNFLETIQTGKDITTRFRFKGKNNEIYWFEEKGSIIKDQSDNVIGIIGVLRNITRRVEAEKKLEEKIKKLERINSLIVGREQKMIKLKEKIKSLQQEIKG